MNHELRALSDEQLLEACHLNPREKRLGDFADSKLGCLVCLVLGAAVAGLVRIGLASITTPDKRGIVTFVAIVALVLVAFMLWLRLHAFVERRRTRYWNELKRRYAGGDASVYLQEIRSADQFPEIAFVFAGAALPSGGRWVTLVRLWSDVRGELVARRLNPSVLHGDRIYQVRLRAGRIELPAERIGELKKLVGELEESRCFDIRSNVIDGCPAEVYVLKRDNRGVIRARCNLAGIPEDKRDVPAVRLMLELSELSEQIPLPTLIAGTYNGLTNSINVGGI